MIIRPIVCRTFIGRSDELAYLHERRRDASASHGGLVLVRGEAGIGKSRLLAEFGSSQANSRGRVGIGRCLEFAQRPYGPILEVLARFGTDASALAPAASKREQFEAIDGAFDQAAKRHARIAIIEDVHWADAATVELLAFLSTRLGTRRMLVVVSFRPEEVHPEHPSFANLAKLERAPGGGRIDLQPLEGAELNRFIDVALAGVELSDELRRAVAAAGEGNPFFVEELLKSAVERRSGAGGDVRELPSAVRVTLMERLRPLDDEERRVLAQAAVIGRDFDIETLAATLGKDPNSLLPALHRARRLQLIVETSRGLFRFRHALTREAMYGDFLAVELQPLHRTIALHIERAPHDDAAVERLAYHWDAAGDAERAARYSELAGDAAATVYAHEDAAAHYARALRRTPAASLEAARLRIKKGFQILCTGAIAAARDAYADAASLFLELGRFDEEIACRARVAIISLLLGDLDPAAPLAALLSRLPRDDRPLAVRTRVALAHTLACCWQYAAAAEHLHAIDLAPQTVPPRVVFEYHNTAAMVACFTGDVARLRAELILAVNASHQVDDHEAHTGAEVNAGLYLALCGRPQESLPYFDRGTQLARERRDRAAESRACAVSAYAYLLLGDLISVRRVLDRFEAMPTDNAMVVSHAAAWGTLAGLHTADDALIARSFDAMSERVCDNGLRFYAPGFAEVLYRRGRVAESHVLLRRALDPVRTQRGAFMVMLAVARFGDLADLELARELLAKEAAAPDVPERPALALFDAFAARRRGERGAAAEFAGRAAEGFRRFGYALLEGTALEVAGDTVGARAIFARAGAHGDLRRLGVAEPQDQGATPASRNGALVDVLSAREHEIAGLVAQGKSNLEIAATLSISTAAANAVRKLAEPMTHSPPLPRDLAPLSRREREVALHVFAGRDNREIAAALGISAKTVESHLSSAFAKLGLRSRAQLVVYVARSCG